jgi:[histone H3]-dimethyl-L-lysine9 demethylase
MKTRIDTCMTSIFSCSWMCRNCGREACAECYEQVRELTLDRPGASGQEIAQLQARREKHAHTNPFFLSCTRRVEHGYLEFSPVTRFCKDELEQAITAMEEVLSKPDVDALPVYGAIDPTLEDPTGAPNGSSTSQTVNGSTASPSLANGTHPNQSITNNGIAHTPQADKPDEAAAAKTTTPTAAATGPEPPSNAGAGGEVPCHPTRHFVDSELTDDVFRPMWIKGEPLVVTGLSSKFKILWSPEYFIEKYGSESCLIVECQKDTNKRVTVGEFFSWFGKYEGRKDCWKLKVVFFC